MKSLIYVLATLFVFTATAQVESKEPSPTETSELLHAPRDRIHKPNSAKAKAPNDFFMVSIPKSGTHLVVKMLNMLTGRTGIWLSELFDHGREVRYPHLAKAFLKCKQNNEYIYHHTGTFYHRRYGSELFAKFARQHPEYVKILQIRDLRDVFVSLVHFIDNGGCPPQTWSEYGLSSDASFDDKLSVAIQHILVSDIKSALSWYNDPTVVVIRFEDLVGTSGGGSETSQQEAILSVANALSIELTDEKLQEIMQNLFGNSSGPSVSWTFRKGKIGDWEKSYTKENKKLFNEIWGTYQQLFGYPLAE